MVPIVLAPIALVLAGNGVLAETEIHRCLLEDGTFAFQETPCPEHARPADDEREPGGDAGNDAGIREDVAVDEEAARVRATEQSASRSMPVDAPPSESGSPDRSECEKKTRDAIDAIDLEMRESATTDQRQAYLARLLALTEQLRACKQR